MISAQLTSPSEPVCPGNPVIFICQQSGIVVRWSIKLQPIIHQTVQSTQVGTTVPFGEDRDFHFELHIVSNVTTKLEVTAVRELNNVKVECKGDSGDFESTIQVASIGVLNLINQHRFYL